MGTRRAVSAEGSGSAGEDGGLGDAPLWKFLGHTAAVKALARVGSACVECARYGRGGAINGTMLNELDTGSQVGFTVLVCGFRAYGRFHLGPEPHMVLHVVRTCLYTRILLGYRT